MDQSKLEGNTSNKQIRAWEILYERVTISYDKHSGASFKIQSFNVVLM